MVRFKLKIGHTDYWFWVIVHDDIADLRLASEAHDTLAGAPRSIRGAGDETGYYGRTLGITHRYERVTYDSDGTEHLHSNNGIIRFAKPYLSTEIVSHELMHAVAWTWRLKYGQSIGRPYKDGGWRDEMLCHMYSRSFSLLNRLMHKKGLWS